MGQRALEQQALERWRMQKEAQIEDMMRQGVPLGAVATALASPETAERIAVLEAATSGGPSALDAARLNVRRAGVSHVTVALTTRLPEVGGRQWTSEDYAIRDAGLAALGVQHVFGRRVAHQRPGQRDD